MIDARVMTAICVVIVPPKECLAIMRAAGAGQVGTERRHRENILMLPPSSKMKRRRPDIL